MATPTIPATTPRGLALVTGGSGYIAGYCIAQLLSDGWGVRTTVRNLGLMVKTGGYLLDVALQRSIDNGWHAGPRIVPSFHRLCIE